LSTATNLAALAAVAAAIAVGVALVKARLGGAGAAPKFKRKALLTPNEAEFLGRLEAAAPELRFCPQVAMGALLDPAVSRSDRRAYFRARGMFSQKIVDFVAQSRADGSVVAIVELDDRTHDSDRDAKRDAMLESAGYRVVRWKSKAKPDAAAIRASLLPPPARAPEADRPLGARAEAAPAATRA
jgi:very-short-patch-repair endonuclease